MLRIGLTGGIGSGKSVVARIFEILEVPVYYADAAARRLMNEDATIRESIVKHFGEKSYVNDKLDRAHIASLVFNNPDKLALLNSLTHPATIQDAANWMKRQTAHYAVKEAALIFESGSQTELDYVIGVSSPKALRIRRVMARDGISNDEVLKRMERQMDEEEKMKRCDFIIINDEEKLVIPQVMEVHSTILSKV